MQKKSKILFDFLLVFAGLFCFSTLASALEIDYPPLPGVAVPTEGTSLTGYVTYIFRLIVFLCGIITFGVLIRGGISYLTAGSNPAGKKAAKEHITAGVIGVAIVLASWLGLSAINAAIVRVSFNKETTPLSKLAEVEVPDPSKLVLTQIPLGVMLEEGLIGQKADARLTTLKDDTEEIRKKAESLKNLNDELKDIVDSYKCGDSKCPGACEAKDGCNVTFSQDELDGKIEEIKAAIEDIKNYRKSDLYVSRWDFDDPRTELKTAAILMSSGCDGRVYVQNEIPGLENEYGDKLQIDAVPDWPSNIITVNNKEMEDPLTFYCDKPNFTDVWEAIKSIDISDNVADEDYRYTPSNGAPITSPPPAGSTDFKLPNYPHLSQTASTNGTIKAAGCGPTSLTTILRYYGQDLAVEVVAGHLRSQGAWGENGLYYYKAVPAIQSKYSLSYDQLGDKDVTKLKDELLKGRPILMDCKIPGYCYPDGKGGLIGHYMVLYGLNYMGDNINRFYIMDPMKGIKKELPAWQIASQCFLFTSFWK
ncbi:MAG: C39 family peptidase [Candidatus Paceibacterota bacterium]|jgi:hypothetical protein